MSQEHLDDNLRSDAVVSPCRCSLYTSGIMFRAWVAGEEEEYELLLPYGFGVVVGRCRAARMVDDDDEEKSPRSAT